MTRRALHAAATAIAAAVAAVGVGCVPASRYHEPRLPVGDADVPGVDLTAAALAGTWTGQYDAPLYARRGALQLSLRRVARVARVSSGAVAVAVVPFLASPALLTRDAVGTHGSDATGAEATLASSADDVVRALRIHTHPAYEADFQRLYAPFAADIGFDRLLLG